jgi:5S rRNA maturation endonuclease (ribonuclease M5)
MFNITDHVEFQRNRAQCPSCMIDGKDGLNLALLKTGAYKCFRGCTPAQIRDALGQPKSEESDRIVPTALAKQPKTVTHTQEQIDQYRRDLINRSKHAINYLKERGFTAEMANKYQLGVAEKSVRNGKIYEKHWCIAIPYQISEGVYMCKYRVAPWLADRPEKLQKWSQDTNLQSRFHFTKKDGNEKLFIAAGDWDSMLLAEIAQNEPFDICTNTTGEGNIPDDLSPLDSYKQIFIFYDLDEAGLKGSKKMAKAIGDRAKICTVPHKENPIEGYDSSNAIADGFKFEDFIAATKLAIAPTKSEAIAKKSLRSIMTTNAELLARAKDYTDWLIEEILPIDELIMVAASPRAGKSLMAMNMAYCIATGTNFMDRPVTQGSVFYVHCEDSETKIKMRQVAQGWDADLPVYWFDKFKLSQLGEMIELAKEMQPRIIILDTLSRIRDDNSTESSAEMGRILEPLQEFAREHNCCVLLVHHTGKIKIDNADTLDVFETIRGSSAIRATCRGTIVIAASESGYRMCIENGYIKQDLRVSLNLSDLTWKPLGKWLTQVDGSQADQVLEILAKTEQATLEQLHDQTLINKGSLYKVLSRLTQEGKISKTGSRKAVLYSRLLTKLSKNISDISDMSDNLSDSEINTPQTIEVMSDKKDISFLSDNTQVQKYADVTTEHGHNLSDCLISDSNQPVQIISESDNISDKPKSVRQKRLKVGDRVRIKKGSLGGLIATVESVSDTEAVLIREDWVVKPSSPLTNLERVK